MPELLGYHACRTWNNRAYILAEAPFISRLEVANPHKDPSLGNGRYLWDQNIDAGHWWGRIRLDNKYYLLEVRVPYSEGQLLDLCDRGHIEQYRRIERQLETMGILANGAPIGKVLHMARTVFEKRLGANSFPWKIVRCEERKNRGRAWRRFREVKNPGFFEMDPLVIICVYPSYPLASLRRRIIHPT